MQRLRAPGADQGHSVTSSSSSLELFCAEKLQALDQRSQRRSPVPTRRLEHARVERVVDGTARVLVDFSSNDSLGLAHHPEVMAAAMAATSEGASSGGSRLVSGAHPSLTAFEATLAKLKHQAAAVVVGSGWLANVGVIPALVGPEDVVVVDALAHASLFAGVRLSGARTLVVAHNDLAAFTLALADERARTSKARILVVTESVFSMDGDRAPVEALALVCRAHDAWLLVDDAHGFLIGDGTCGPADVVTGTLSKASGSYGGTIAGPRALIDLLFTRCRPLLFSTALPPAVIAAAAAAVDVALREPARRHRPLLLARRFCAAMGLPPPSSHIVPVVVGDEAATLGLMAALVDDGHLAVAIRPPTVAAGTSRLRIAFSAAHSDDDVDALASSLLRRRAR
ncbi:MAG: aminotransferase class I/II-fold pyridoxal phosphate-dependent enzyme [Deltaproteobacteria bacterium]|nr:aminotransferase class I/II-fold pyridoxal phosphate-dependent enzyme [Deltaproteobacteria bacterium]